jgi:ferrochelatase
VARAGIPADKHSVSFQSRLAGEPWLTPFTDHELVRLAQAGRKRLLIFCPAFVADCLETIEEISGEGKETFLGAGGTSFQQVPCLNDHPAYIDFLAHRCDRWLTAGSV